MKVPRMVADEAHRYTLRSLLGRGSSGSVYAAKRDDGYPCAVKVLHDLDIDAGDAHALARHRREGRCAMRITSPFVAAVLSFGQTDGVFWLVYERLPGQTLEHRLTCKYVLELDVARRVIAHVLAGVSAAHGVDVIHRDLKPSNVVLVDEPEGLRACILDFGTAKHLPVSGDASTGQLPLTTTAETIGTIAYMPPEQIEDASRVDGRADLYAAGVIAYRLLTGSLPFKGNPAAIVQGKLHQRPPTLRKTTGMLWPPRLEAFIMRALARRPEARFQTAENMLAAWEEATMHGSFPDVAELRRHLERDANASEDTAKMQRSG